MYWLTLSANNGEILAMEELGVIYAHGLLDRTVDKNTARQGSQKAIDTRKKLAKKIPRHCAGYGFRA